MPRAARVQALGIWVRGTCEGACVVPRAPLGAAFFVAPAASTSGLTSRLHRAIRTVQQVPDENPARPGWKGGRVVKGSRL
jgi:hypothetical protein